MTNIKAGESTFTQDQSQKSVNAGVSYGNNAVQVSAGYSQNQNSIIQTTHQNSQILASNFNLTTKEDTNIIGGNIKANTAMLNIGGNLVMETLQDTYEESGDGFGISIGGSSGSSSSSGSSANNSPKTGGVQNIGMSMTYKDIFKATTGEKTGITADSLTLNVTGTTTDLTDKKDRQFVNGDFEGGISVPTALLTKDGRAGIGKAYREFGSNTSKTWNDTGGAVWRGRNTDIARGFSKVAMEAYDERIIQTWGLSDEEIVVRGLEKPDPQAHENAAKAWGAYVGNPLVALLFRGASEFGYQYPKYSSEYNQYDLRSSMYDPMGRYDPNLPHSDFKPDLSGNKYFEDSLQDIKNSINGSLDVKSNSDK